MSKIVLAEGHKCYVEAWESYLSPALCTINYSHACHCPDSSTIKDSLIKGLMSSTQLTEIEVSYKCLF